MGFRPKICAAYAVTGVILAPVALAACAHGDVICEPAPASDTIVGTLVARRGATATFAIESARRGDSTAAGGFGPMVTAGRRVAVEYDRGQSQFLRVGSRYRVELFWLGKRFGSEVHDASQACSLADTTYADGRPIDTSLWSRSSVRRDVYAAALAVVGACFIGVAAATRRRRRQRRNDANLKDASRL